MRLTTGLVAVLAGLVLAGCGGGDQQAGQAGDEQPADTAGVLGETAEQPIVDEPITFQLNPLDGSGVSGTVTMQPVEGNRDRTAFSIEVEGAQQLTDANPATIERGSCAALDTGGEELASLGDVVEGSLDRGVVTLSPLELLDGDFAVVVHGTAVAEGQDTAIACADVPDKADVDLDAGGTG